MPSKSVYEMPGQRGAALAAIIRSEWTVIMKPPKYLLPSEVYPIPTVKDATVKRVLVIPPTPWKADQARPN